jgi:hypothetical protein
MHPSEVFYRAGYEASEIQVNNNNNNNNNNNIFDL